MRWAQQERVLGLGTRTLSEPSRHCTTFGAIGRTGTQRIRMAPNVLFARLLVDLLCFLRKRVRKDLWNSDDTNILRGNVHPIYGDRMGFVE